MGPGTAERVVAKLELWRRHRQHTAAYRRTARTRTAVVRLLSAAGASPPSLAAGEAYIKLKDLQRLLARLFVVTCGLRTLQRWATEGRWARVLLDLLVAASDQLYWTATIPGRGRRGMELVVPVRSLRPGILEEARVMGVPAAVGIYEGTIEERLRTYLKAHDGKATSFRQIARTLRIRRQTVAWLMRALEQQGAIAVLKLPGLGIVTRWNPEAPSPVPASPRHRSTTLTTRRTCV